MSRAGADPFVERVRSASDLLQLVQGHVELKRVGERWRGLCPFHNEKTPSFYVSPSHQTYHCFGCSASGDVFSFVMEQERMSFPEALEYLAERAGIPRPVQRREAGDALERIRQALRIAADYYANQLAAPGGARARAYLEARGISADAVRRYRLGVAPDAWDGLLSHARRLSGERALVEAGLAVEGESGRIYDRFRNRLMIPIESAGGAPIGFGGRTLGDDAAKYLNSPETAVYHKSSVLFGVRQAREASRGASCVLVVEGYFDVIALMQAAVGPAVGTCGTALTREHCAVLRRMSDRVVLLFDGDDAGRKAALRALPIALAGSPDVRVASPPRGEDPDTWVRGVGPDAVRRKLEEAPSALAFLEGEVSGGGLPRRDALEHAYGVIRAIPDPLRRELLLAEAANRLQVPPDAFRERLAKDGVGRAATSPARTGANPAASSGRAAGPREGAWDRVEVECLRTALDHPSIAAEIARALEAIAGSPSAVDLLHWISDRSAGGETGTGGEISNTAARLLSLAVRERPDAARLTALFAGDLAAPVSPWELLLRLEARKLQRDRSAITAEIRRAEERKDSEALASWLEEKQRLGRRADELARLLLSREVGSGSGQDAVEPA